MRRDRQSGDIAAQAAEWFAAMRAECASAGDAEAFREWLRADPRHRRAYEQMQALWTELGELRDRFPAEDYRGTDTVGDRRRSHRAAWYWAAAAAVLSVVVGGVIGLTSVTEPHPGAMKRPQAVATRTAEVRQVALADGSSVTLGGSSAIEIDYTASRRCVVLLAGEAYFDVTADPARPFVVDVGDAEILAVGTQFEIRRSTGGLRVAVVEGAVEIVTARPHAGGQRHVLGARQKARLHADGSWSALPVPSGERPGAWREGRLTYDNAPLGEVIADADRYYQGNIMLDTGDLADITVTASFRTDQIPQTIMTLSSALPLTAKLLPNGDIVIRRRDTGGA